MKKVSNLPFLFLLFFGYLIFLYFIFINKHDKQHKMPKMELLQQDGIPVSNSILPQLNSKVKKKKSCFLAHVSINAIEMEIMFKCKINFK